MSSRYAYQKRMGTEHPNHIPPNILKKRNKDKSWVRGYDEDYDIVILSKDGTISQPYELQGVKMCTPAIPEDETEIRGHDLNKEDQVWKRIEYPDELIGIEAETVSWNKDKANKDNYKTPSDIFYMKPKAIQENFMNIIKKDFEYRKMGVWVYINGKPTWIPPEQYFFLQNIPVYASTYGDFRFSNNDFFLFWETCVADYRSLGMQFVKGRRSGASTFAGSIMLNRGSSSAEALLGHMNINKDDAGDYMKDMVIRPFKKLPWWIKPATSGTTDASSGLEFRNVAKRLSSKTTVVGAEEGLDTILKVYPTTKQSMDGRKMNFIHLDEFSKLPTSCPAEACWAIKATCLTVGFKVVGKALVSSTVNPMDHGGRGFKNIYQASSVKQRLDSGRTVSGLYAFFIPAHWAMEGGYDKFGYSIVDDPIVAIENEYGASVKQGNYNRIKQEGASKKRVSDVMYAEYIRQYPLTEQHAFRDSATASDFNILKIEDQIEHNEHFMQHQMGGDGLTSSLYERGNFINKNHGTESYDIEWIPSPRGRFLVSWFPPEELRNNFRKRGGTLVPMNDFGCFGIDTYKFDKVVDSRGGSKAAMHGVTGNSINLGAFPQNKFFLEYIERPPTVQAFMKDMIHAMLYYGIPALIENNVPNLLEHMKREGLTGFALRRKDKAKLTESEKSLGGIPMTSDKVQQDHYMAIQTYIEQHVGEANDSKYRAKEEMGECPFNRMLSSWAQFGPQNRTTEDASISSGLALMGVKMMHSRSESTPNKTTKAVMKGFFQEHDYSHLNKRKY